jgi:ElaB/YqjD/DUF883 family membrane-anchored ribosome-binding protein
MKKTTLLAVILITQSLNPLITNTAFAGPGHDHTHGSSEKTEITIPETRDELWQAIQAEHATLLEAVGKKSDGEVHTTEEKLQAYLEAMPGKITDLEEGVRKRIEGQTRNLARAYDAVHHAADDKAWDKAAAEMKKADGGMKLLAAQMPK